MKLFVWQIFQSLSARLKVELNPESEGPMIYWLWSLRETIQPLGTAEAKGILPNATVNRQNHFPAKEPKETAAKG